MKPYPTIRSFALAALLAISLPPSPSEAVSISLVPDGSTTIEIGETVNVDVFMVLDIADQMAGIDAVTFQLEGGRGLVTVTASTTGSVFLHPPSIVNAKTVFPHPADFIAFSQFGAVVNTAEAFLASLTLTGAIEGSYDLVARRAAARGLAPLFTAPGDKVNRYDFASNEALVITVTCSTGSCPVASPDPVKPLPPDLPPILPDLPLEEPPPEIAGSPADDPPVIIPPPPDRCEPGRRGQCNLQSPNGTTTTIITTETATFANPILNTLTETLAFAGSGGNAVVPEPSTFALLGLALTGLMLLRSPRRKRSKRSPGSRLTAPLENRRGSSTTSPSTPSARAERSTMRVSIILMGFGLALGPTLIAGSVQARSDDHLQCYRIKDPLRLEGFVDISSMQFGLERGCEISTAVLFCVPADDENLEVRDERRENEGDHDDEDDSDSDGASSKITLLPLSARPAPGDRICYRVRCPRSDAPVIEVTDPFGTRTIRRFRTRMLCTPAVKGTEHCGDGSITGTEECEPTDDSACPGLCSPDCSCGASQPTCGNGLLDPNEDCDFGDLGGATCWDQGFSFGTLACGAGCTFDTSGCTDTRFVDNGDGTVSDNQTGLMWEKKVAGSGCLHCVGDRYTWFDAMGDWISEVNSFTFSGKKTQSGFAGHSDWRIPKVSELEAIILLLNVNVPCPRRICIDPIFGSTGSSFYWSSSTFANLPSSAWVVPFRFRGIGSGGFDKLSTSRVRAVRGGM